MALLSLFFVVFSGVSCVKEEYDMSEDNLNLEVTPFEDGLTLPLGSTEKISMDDILKDVDADILNKDDQTKAYSIKYDGEFEVDEKTLESLQEIAVLPDIDFTQEFGFEFNDVDVSDIKSEAQKYVYEYDLSGIVESPDFKIDVEENVEVSAGLTGYVPNNEELKLDFDTISLEDEIFSFASGVDVPGFISGNDPIPVMNGLLAEYVQPSYNFETENAVVNVDITLPDGVSSVEDVKLDEDAEIMVSLEITGDFLESGKIIPNVNLDLGSIFKMDGYNSGVINLKDMTLSDENGYKASKKFGISALAIQSSDWNKNKLDKAFEVAVAGGLEFEDLMTTGNRIKNLISSEAPVNLAFHIDFVDLQIEDVVMGLEDIEVSDQQTVPFEIDNMAIPEEITGVRDVTFTESSVLDIEIKAENMMGGLELELSELVLSFPQELKVEGTDANNRLVIKDVNLAHGFSHPVQLLGIDLPKPVNGSISFNGNIGVKAVAVAGGTVHSATLPSRAEDDLKVLVDVKANIEVADYKVDFSGYDYDINFEGNQISVEIPESVADLNEIIIYPKGSASIFLEFIFPESGLDVTPGKDGIEITFPEMIDFGTFYEDFRLPSGCKFNPVTNTITMTEFPSHNVDSWTALYLNVKRLILKPVLDPTDNKYYARGDFSVKGCVSVEPGTLTKDQIADLADPEIDNKFKVNVEVSEFVPSTIDFDSYETTIKEEVEFKILSKGDLPKELAAIGKVGLKDTYLNLVVNAYTLPNLGHASLAVDLDVQIPEMIEVEGVDEATGILNISGVFKNSYIEFEPIKVKSLDLTGVDLNEDIIDKIIVDGNVKLTDASLWVDEMVEVGFKAELNASITNINISEITGLDYSIDPVEQYVDFSDFSKMLSDLGAEAALDFNHVHLAMNVETNLGIPVEADLSIIPYYDGEEGKAIEVKGITLNSSSSYKETAVTRYWIADNAAEDDGNPDNDMQEYRVPGKDYELLKVDLLSLLAGGIPDELRIRLNASTDPEKTCVLESGDDVKYSIKADYLFELPLEFGEKFEVTYKTEIPDLPEIVGSLLAKGNKVKLAGEIVNSLPLGLDLKLNFLDSEGNVVSAAEGCGVQRISPCGLDGSASATPLNIVVAVADFERAKDITSLELEFVASSGDVIGVPVTSDSYLQANLQLVLPEGITVDLNDFLNNEEK